ncbi:DEAD/DEAH box helicase [uncultured Georgenia sp.]|uniref:DEAD/DEAH box helicase n=1 Tax=uncultured Georgenia sp. TaxID=378209 RepID=UPI00262D1062|nr:DEAD/DEAH box helicase [uncultured Georgenia sp.]
MQLTESDARALARLTLPDDTTLRRWIDAPTVGRGIDYARRGMVRRLHVDPDERALFATVKGSGAASYQTFVLLERGEVAITCTCPVRIDCKHGVAAVVAARDHGSGQPDWERALDGAVRESSASGGEPVGLQLERVVGRGAAAAPGRTAARVRVVPVVRGARGTWVRTGVTWHSVRWTWGRFVPAHVEALRALVGSHPNAYAQHVFLDELGPAVWTLLQQAVDAGVALVPHRGTPGEVTLSRTPAEVTLDVTAHPIQDGVRVAPVVSVAGRAVGAHAVAFIGHPVHGVAVSEEGLLLAPLRRPMPLGASELVTGEALHIPPGDVERFRREFLPRLRRLLPVGSSDAAVDLPEVLTPTLALSVTHLPDHVVRLAWAFRYRTPDGVTDVPVGQPPQDRDAGWVRDLPGEARLLDTLVLPPGLPRLRATPPARGPEPVVELRRLDTAHLARVGLPRLREDNPELVVEVHGEAPDYRLVETAPTVRLTATDSTEGDWFDLEVTVQLDGEDVPFGHLFRALAAGEEHLFLPSGSYFSLDHPELDRLRELIAEAGGLHDEESGTVRVTPYQADLWEELRALGVVDAQSERWRRTVSALLSGPPAGSVDLPAGLHAELRGYQREGFEWLATLWDAGLGGILADDMGLGKTLQTLAVVARAKETGRLDHPVLVVAPTSVVGGWASEAERFTPGLVVRTVEQTSAKAGVPLAERVAGADVVVTSYALLRIDFASYDALGWSVLVLDEAQFVKNHQAKTHQCARRLDAPVKLAISGTPLENSLMDLWSLLSITAPGLFPDPRAFTEAYRVPIEREKDTAALERLRRRTRPFIRRRTKEEVAAELPPKQEQLLSVPLTPRHRRIYDTHLARERRKILGLVDDLDKNRFTIFRSLTLLRQLALAPALVDEEYAGVGSSKAEAFLELLGEVVAEGHRALVFSQFTGYLGLVRDRLEQQGVDYCYLDGTTTNRAARIREFKEGHAPVFLISLKAGGFGLNLTEADYCFMLDPWWNPAVENQAIDRTHRIGQTRTVMVYRMVAEGTIEEKVMALAERKRELFDRVLAEGTQSAASPLTADDIRELLSA